MNPPASKPTNEETDDEKLKLVSRSGAEINWSKEHEKILIEWADKAMCYRWLHSRSNALYSKLNAWYTIPVIIISTLTGTANFAQDRVPAEWQNPFVMAVGGFNLLAGIISTIQQFLKITQLNEAHRVGSIAWDKFYRNVKIELAKHPAERIHVVQMIKMCKEEFDRLIETSPVIPDKEIESFKESFKDSEYYEAISKPEICDVLVSTETFRNPWLNEENIDKRLREEIHSKNIELSKKKDMNKEYEKIVLEFKNGFYKMNNRYPLDDEIIDNLKTKIEISLLKTIISDIKKIKTAKSGNGNIHDPTDVNSSDTLLNDSYV